MYLQNTDSNSVSNEYCTQLNELLFSQKMAILANQIFHHFQAHFLCLQLVKTSIISVSVKLILRQPSNINRTV